jgi:3-deoxy-7-phosphoheptulonate synthase
VTRLPDWTPTSWESRPAAQQPTYPDRDHLAATLARIARLPPLVTSGEIEQLKGEIDKASRREGFVLQGGDCAESFDACTPDAITSKLKVLLQMKMVLVHGTRSPVTLIGRIAGQYAKPRTSEWETRDGVTLPAYRGDNVNRAPFTLEDRTPDPELLLRGHERAAMTLNFIRALREGGFSDLHHPEQWDLDFVAHSAVAGELAAIVQSIRDAISFTEVVSGVRFDALRDADTYTSHEGLFLPYESALTRRVPRREGWYDLSTHMPWIGMRTADLDGGHVAFFAGIKNPVGVKVGPGMSSDWLCRLIERLNPADEPGKIVLIARLGATKVEEHLPGLIEAVRRGGRKVMWMVDPMHGNTETTSNGYKTRRFENILREIELSFDIHKVAGSWLGGVHFELTGEAVTECIGGARGLHEGDLHRAYESLVDPRLNYEQSMEVALMLARLLRQR